jgi:small subunit ribosomal protein S1
METPDNMSEQPGDSEKVAPDPSQDGSAAGPTDDLRIGQRVKGRIVLVGEEDAFLDFGGRCEGLIATRELKDEKGSLKYGVGDTLVASVESVEGQIVLTLGRRPGPLGKELLRQRFESRLPIEGVIKGTNKGGFEVNLGGRRAFCPYSQIDTAYCDKPDAYVGQRLSFLIVRMDGGARNIVLSRRAIMEEERKKKAEETEARLREGEVFEGIVSRVLPFGAFIDIGGVEGLLHVSEFSHSHVADAATALAPNQTVRVKVIAVESGKKGRRISLSMKALEPDPWTLAAETLKPGTVVTGKVARLADFGAFIEIAPGVDGLLHVSEIALGHVKHPKEVLTPGETIEVKILDIDPEKRRIALSHKAIEADTKRKEEKARPEETRRRRKDEERTRPPEQAPAPTESLDTLLERLKEKYQDDTLG